VNGAELAELDPTVFVRTALAGLPAPEQATAEDVQTATATALGLTVRSRVVTEAWQEVTCRVLADEAGAVELDDCALLKLLSKRCETARDELRAWLDAAPLARPTN
jgi:ribosome maturation factor RimP